MICNLYLCLVIFFQGKDSFYRFEIYDFAAIVTEVPLHLVIVKPIYSQFVLGGFSFQISFL